MQMTREKHLHSLAPSALPCCNQLFTDLQSRLTDERRTDAWHFRLQHPCQGK